MDRNDQPVTGLGAAEVTITSSQDFSVVVSECFRQALESRGCDVAIVNRGYEPQGGEVLVSGSVNPEMKFVEEAGSYALGQDAGGRYGKVTLDLLLGTQRDNMLAKQREGLGEYSVREFQENPPQDFSRFGYTDSNQKMFSLPLQRAVNDAVYKAADDVLQYLQQLPQSGDGPSVPAPVAGSAERCGSGNACGGGAVCVDGQCKAAGATCSYDMECPGDEICESGRCILR